MSSCLVIDGSFMLHRARFVAEKQEIPNWDYCVYLFMRSLIVCAEKFSPKTIYVLWDKNVSIHRSKILPEYKAHRIRDPDDTGYKAYKGARDFLHNNLPKLGIISVLTEGIEADDFAYLIASQNERGVLGSDDRDWYLNIFPEWTLFRPRADEKITYNDLCELTTEHTWPRITYLVSKALVGDQSDNIPGINGIGWGYAKKFAPLIVNKQPLGGGAKAKLVEDNMELVRKNTALMDPSWILHSEFALKELRTAEENTPLLENAVQEWRNFNAKLPKQKNYEFKSWWYRYHSIARKFGDKTCQKKLKNS